MRTETNTQNILRHYGLKKTHVRLAVLAQFKKAGCALSYPDIERRLGDGFDKSTLYRTLHSFEKAGLIHRVSDTDGILKFALLQPSSGHDHAHFKCHQCNNTYCLDSDGKININLPSGFRQSNITVLVTGICNHCI